MQLVGVSDLSQLGDANQIATVLGGLADGVARLQKKDENAFTQLRENINHLDSNSKGLFGQLMNKASGSLLGLYDKYAEDQHLLMMTIEAAADKDSIRTQALDDALSGMLGSIRNGSFVLNGQLAEDRKNLYGLDGSVRRLGDESAMSLSRLLRSAQSQSSSADSALAMAQKVNADRVASVRDVVIAFVGVVVVAASSSFTARNMTTATTIATVVVVAVAYHNHHHHNMCHMRRVWTMVD
jgi:hypothetical protein